MKPLPTFGIRPTAISFEQKTTINKRFQELYERGRRRGTHGHYETMFGAMHQAYAEFLDPTVKNHNMDDATDELEWK